MEAAGRGREREQKSPIIFNMRFPQKLWWLVGQGGAGGAGTGAAWGRAGRTVLLDYRVLDAYLREDTSVFKTTHISSFIRQLNLYGFRKVTSHHQDPLCNSNNPHMNEFVHDYFMCGRPELLDKITRKNLNTKRPFKLQKRIFPDITLSNSSTPLQRARNAFHIALAKAAHDLYYEEEIMNAMACEQEDASEGEESEDVKFDWSTFQNVPSTQSYNYVEHPAPIAPVNPINLVDPIPYPTNYPESSIKEDPVIMINDEEDSYNKSTPAALMEYNDVCKYSPETARENAEHFTNQFLSMPSLGVAELNDVNNNCTENMNEIEDNSFNCELPPLYDYTVDNSSLAENMWRPEQYGQYHGEWDQMFKDIMASKEPATVNGSDLQDLYCQISKTIDLLNS